MKKFIFFLFVVHYSYAQNLKLELIGPPVNSSFRGMSVVDDKVVWISGSAGWVGVSNDSGLHWDFHQIPDFDKVDFRSLYAFSSTRAIVANAGSPASILATVDGGKTWKETYHNDNKDIFIDGVDFWDENEGVMYGDPIDGKLMILHTKDGGNSWEEFSANSRPVVSAGQASFAASGTGVHCYPNKEILIATGGTVSQLFKSNDYGKHWDVVNVPVIQGKASTGIFSVAFQSRKQGVVVGGDYLIDSLKINHVFITENGGKTWSAPVQPTRGYRECVEYLTAGTLVAAGPSGLDVSYDGGINWLPLSDEKGFHVIRKARKGSLIVAAGSKGKIGLIK